MYKKFAIFFGVLAIAVIAFAVVIAVDWLREPEEALIEDGDGVTRIIWGYSPGDLPTELQRPRQEDSTASDETEEQDETSPQEEASQEDVPAQQDASTQQGASTQQETLTQQDASAQQDAPSQQDTSTQDTPTQQNTPPAQQETPTQEEAPEAAPQPEIPPEDLAPDFAMYNANGNRVNLSDFFGRPIILNFWTTWCPGCVVEMPYFQQLYAEVGSDVQIIKVNLREDREHVESFMTNNGFDFPLFFDAGTGATAYSVQFIPITFFIDSQGQLVSSIPGVATLDALLQELERLS